MDTYLPREKQSTTAATLRQFAGLCFAIFGALFVVSWNKHAGHPTIAAWIGLAFAVVVGLPGLFKPALIRPVFVGITAATAPIGHVISTVLLAVVYYAVVTPLAALFRLIGRDVLLRRRPAVDSYWLPKHQPADPRRYLRTYQKQ